MVSGELADEGRICGSIGAAEAVVMGAGLAGRVLACPSAPVTVASGKNKRMIVNRTSFI